MKGKVSFVLNKTKYEFELDDADALQLYNQLITMGQPPRDCPYLKNERYELRTNKDSDKNIYVNMMAIGEDKKKSQKTAYRAKLGLYKDKSGVFWNWWEKDDYLTKKLRGDKQTKQPRDSSTEIGEGDIPF